VIIETTCLIESDVAGLRAQVLPPTTVARATEWRFSLHRGPRYAADCCVSRLDVLHIVRSSGKISATRNRPRGGQETPGKPKQLNDRFAFGRETA
jgi:hypothetical protein